MKETIELNHSISMKKNPNSGIEILKVILTFFILVYHCSNQNAYNSEILNIFNHVVPFYFSTYFLIFFYFSYNILSSKNIVRIKQRLLRVLIPYIFWPLIFSVIHILSYKKKININYLIRDIAIQLILGRRIYFVFWFQFNLIMSFLLISIIFLFFKKYHLYIFQSLFLMEFILEYSGNNDKFFELFNEDIKRSVGRILKMMVIALAGFLLSSIKMLNFLKNHKIKSICFILSSFTLIIYLNLFYSNFYFLEGIYLILGSIFLMIPFAFLPLNKITNMKIIFLIKQWTSYTAGIYYLHIKVHKYFGKNLIIMRDGTLMGCAFNYLICYSICFFGMKIFRRTKFKYLFI